MRLSIGVGQVKAPIKAAPDLFAEVERKEFPVKGRARAVVASEGRPA